MTTGYEGQCRDCDCKFVTSKFMFDNSGIATASCPACDSNVEMEEVEMQRPIDHADTEINN